MKRWHVLHCDEDVMNHKTMTWRKEARDKGHVHRSLWVSKDEGMGGMGRNCLVGRDFTLKRRKCFGNTQWWLCNPVNVLK